MQKVDSKNSFIDKKEATRYFINGVIATLIHFTILTVNIKLLHFHSAGIANFIAAIFGITASFIGSRYYVYQNHSGTFTHHAVKFFLLYVIIALLHGLTLWIWTDIYQHSWEIGFMLATFIQVSLSYVGNKVLVFT